MRCRSALSGLTGALWAFAFVACTDARDTRVDAAVGTDAAVVAEAGVDASALSDVGAAADGAIAPDVANLDATASDAAADAGAPPSALLPVDGFLASIAVSRDGTVAALGFMPSASPGNSGAVAVYRRGPMGWTREATLQPGDLDEADWFGGSVSLDAQGDTLAVGMLGDDGTYMNQGAVRLYRHAAGVWSEEARWGSINPGNDAAFGRTVALSSDGTHVAVASLLSARVGYVEVFTYAGGRWAPPVVQLSSRLGSADGFGASLAWADTGALVVGAPTRSVALVFASPQATTASYSLEGDRRTLPAGYTGLGYGSTLGVSADGLDVVVGSDDVTWHHRFVGAAWTLERRIDGVGPHVALDAAAATLATASVVVSGSERTAVYTPPSAAVPQSYAAPSPSGTTLYDAALALAGGQLFIARERAVEVITLP
jgi:hypothetical protein